MTWECDLLVLDFDGVILQSAEIKVEGFATLFADRPAHVEEIVAFHRRSTGVSRYRQFEAIYAEILHEPLSPACSAALGARLSELCLGRILACPPVPGAMELLACPRRPPVWIASGTPHDELLGIMDRRGMSGTAGVRGTPNTKVQTVEEALAHHVVDPSAAVFVGDALTDEAAAAATGLTFVGVVTRGVRSSFGSDVVTVPDLVELDAAVAAAMRR